MLKKKLMSLGIAVVFTLSSLTTTVFAADFNIQSKGSNVTIKFTNPSKYNGNGQNKNNKEKDKKYKFDDVDDSSISWAFNAIEKLAGKGIVGGIGNGKYAPRNKVTQLEALVMVLRLTGDNDEAESRKNQVHPLYKGLKSTWGMGYVFVAIEKGILLPEELRDFNPNTPAKRHEIAKYIIRAMGETKEALKYMDEKLPFSDGKDVPEKSVGYVYLANKLNIMIGNDNKFKPMEPVTRAEMAVLLDRAEGKFELPDTDNRKNGTVFVSADINNNKITVTVKGITATYNVLEDAQVYKNDSFETIEALVKGDVLQLTLNDDKEVIFIEVIKEANDDENEADDKTEVSFRTESYDNLPEVLKDKVDDLKSTENYKAYEYGGYIYLLTTLGKQSTGGYDIDVEKTYKYIEDGEYIVEAVVDTDEPSSDSTVTQAITYPYSVVKFKSFDDIEEIVFVDKDNDELDTAEVTVIDEVYENELSFEAVDYDELSDRLKDQVDYLKLNRNYKAYEYDNYVYLIAAMGKKTSDDYKIDIDNVFKVENDGEYTIKAEVNIDQPSSTNGNETVYPYSIVKFKNFNDINGVRFVDGDNDKLAETKIVELGEEITVEGTISSISSNSKTIRVEKTNGSFVTLTIPTDAEITVNDDANESFSDLVKGMKVEVEVIDERVTKVVAEDTIAEVTGTLTAISISTEKKITLRVGNTSKTYTVNSDVKVIIDGETAEVDDLRVNSELTIKFTNGLLSEIEK